MSDPISEQVSAFLDGELPENETELLLKRLTRDVELRDRFGRYSLLGEALRASVRSAGPTRDFAAAVARRIDPEPAISAPDIRSAKSRTWWRPLAGAALAAGVAAIAVVALERRADDPPTFATNRPALSAVVATRSAADAPQAPTDSARPREALSYTVPAASSDAPVLSSPRLANYVFAHSNYSSLLGQRNMLSGLIADSAAPNPAPPATKSAPTPSASGKP